MDASVSMEPGVIDQLIKLQDLDRDRDRLQRRLDDVPLKLKRHTDALDALDRAIAEQETLFRTGKAESDRVELELRVKEEEREKIKLRMNAADLSNREYEVLQEGLAGVLADINSLSDSALKSMERASEGEEKLAELRCTRDETEEKYLKEKGRLEEGLSGVKMELEAKTTERDAQLGSVNHEGLAIYERVRRKHRDAIALVDGTIDRAAGRMGNDVHCSACYINITPNDALRVLARRSIVQCKSCVRILYVP